MRASKPREHQYMVRHGWEVCLRCGMVRSYGWKRPKPCADKMPKIEPREAKR